MIDEILAFLFVVCVFAIIYCGYRIKMQELDERYREIRQRAEYWSRRVEEEKK